MKIKRIYNYIIRSCKDFVRNISRHLNDSNSLKADYVNWLFSRNNQKSEEFVDITEDYIETNAMIPKVISFYLPQYYETPYNNEHFGKGFTEWNNVTKAIPQYTGHNQPQLPIDLGFYNLKNVDTMYRQIELAKKYGIYGFCFYYYWFSGETLLEKPILNFLNDKNLDFPFCLMWTNETWTSVWGDGNHKKVIKQQELLDNDDEKFVNDFLKYIKDERYIKIGGKPLLIIYQTQKFERERFKQFLNNLRTKIKDLGYEGIYLLTTNAGDAEVSVKEFLVEGIIEFSHQSLPIQKYEKDLGNCFINKDFQGKILDIEEALKNNAHIVQNTYKTFRCVYPGWDNTARKAYKSGCYVFDMTPKTFKKWFSDVVNWTKNNHTTDEQLVFVNAWNEWAEGAHLEPDRKYGYGYLQAIKDVLEETKN